MRSLWHVTQYVPTSSRAGVAAVALVAAGGVDAGVPAWFADSVAEIVAINAIDPQAIISVNGFCRMRIGFSQVPSATDLRHYSGRHLFCAWQGWPSFGSAPCFSRISAPALLYRTPPRRSPKPDAASQGVTPALLTTFTSASFSISSSSNLFQPR